MFEGKTQKPANAQVGTEHNAYMDCEDKLGSLFSLTENLITINDTDTLMDHILSEARRLARADAGSIFLVQGEKLRFSYVHNQSLFSGQAGSKYHYVDYEIDVDETSLAGYVAKTGNTLVLDDVYEIPGDRPYSFNRDFDQNSGYRTKSMLVAPMMTGQGKVVGVLQVINAEDHEGRVIPFSEKDQAFISFYANNAGIALERAMMTREMIMRMIKVAELRDPKETGAHVNRVGAYCAEIYESVAIAHGREADEIKKRKDLVRVASMLHDVGKVAVSDSILRKPARLDPDEFDQIKFHTIYGARLFNAPASELDQLSREIALNHHERWDGRGYPGHIGDISLPDLKIGAGKKGTEIPLEARVAALADVYDALVSRRAYKDPWPEDKVLSTIKDETGRHFDPEVVDAFMSIYDLIRTIRQRYPE